MDDTTLTAELVWAGDLRFGATSGSSAIVVDSDGADGPSPMQLLAAAIAGCMAVDVVLIVQKGRHPLRALRVSFAGERSPGPPRRLTRVALAFHVTGDVPAEAVQRALDLSREKYCSVWHTVRPDVELTTTFQIHP